IPLFSTIGVGGNYSYTGTSGHSVTAGANTSDGDTTGTDFSTSDTESRTTDTSHSLQTGGSLSQTVSSSTSITTSITVNVLPAQAGQYYRQVTRWIYPGQIIGYDFCGNPTHLADVTVDDFKWSQDFGQGPTCSPNPPPSNLPKGQCYIAPCEGL